MKYPRTSRRVILPGLLLVMLVTVVIRWNDTGARLLDTPRDISLLEAAMSAGSGVPYTMADLARLGATYTSAEGVDVRALARLAQLSDQPAIAQRWLQAGVASGGEPNLTLFELCRLYWDQGDLQQALATCANSRSSARYWLNRGYVASDAGRVNEAIGLYAMAAATDPALAEAWHQLGRAYFSEQQLDDAILALNQQLALGESVSVDVYRVLGEAYLQQGESVAARDILRDGLVNFPDDRFLAQMLATALTQLGELAMAEQEYQRLTAKYPGEASIWADWGIAAEIARDFPAATSYLHEALRLDPTNVSYWLMLVDVASEAGDMTTTARAYRELMMLRPEDVGLWLDAGRFWLESGQLQEARFVLDRVIQLDPENEDAARLRQILLESTVTIEDSAAQQP